MNIADTIKILKRLRMVQVEYPTHLLESRRADFFDQVAAIRADMKANQPNAQSSSSGNSLSGNAARMVEQALRFTSIGMFVAASALGIYTFREEISNFFSPQTADIQPVDDLVESPIPLPSDEPTMTMTPTPTFTETPFSFTATPGPRDDDAIPVATETKPGLRLGHTPKPPKPDDGD